MNNSNNKSNSFRNLLIWQKGIELVKEVYVLTNYLPKEELFALSDQIRRSAISVPSNIAEGWGRYSKRYFMHFLSIARGSLFEVETQILLAIDLSYFDAEIAEKSLNICEELTRMLNSLLKKEAEHEI